MTFARRFFLVLLMLSASAGYTSASGSDGSILSAGSDASNVDGSSLSTNSNLDAPSVSTKSNLDASSVSKKADNILSKAAKSLGGFKNPLIALGTAGLAT